MANINQALVINDKNRTIEMSKAFSKMAHQFGTAEYDDLQAVRKDYPRYREVIVKPSRKNDTFKGLNKSFMRQYIAMNKKTKALTTEQYKEIIQTMREGFCGCRPNDRIATALVLEGNLVLLFQP